MNELVNAGSAGISYKDLSRRWSTSPINDSGAQISERTFFRLRQDLQSLFDVDIDVKSHTDNRYVVSLAEHSVFIGMFCRLITANSESKPTLHDLMLHVMKGMEITTEEKQMIEDIAFKLNRIAYETLGGLITAVNEGAVKGADRAQWADIKYHTCIWLEETFQRIDSWVGVAIERKGADGNGFVRFYIVNETDDADFHRQLIKELDLLPPKRLDNKFHWFAPRDPSLHAMTYSSQPDLSLIKSRVETLSKRLNRIKK